MHILKKKIMILFLAFFSLSLTVEIVKASESIRVDTTIGISIAVIIAAIATIIAFFTLGGIKYVRVENVLNTEVRKTSH